MINSFKLRILFLFILLLRQNGFSFGESVDVYLHENESMPLLGTISREETLINDNKDANTVVSKKNSDLDTNVSDLFLNEQTTKNFVSEINNTPELKTDRKSGNLTYIICLCSCNCSII